MLGTDRRIFVFDLDGVVRNFDSLEIDAQIEQELGLPNGTLWHLTMESTELKQAVTGGLTRLEWEDLIEAELRARTHTGVDVARSFQRWRDNVGKLDSATVDIIESLRAKDLPVFLFTNGTDRVPAELAALGVAELFHGVLNSFKLRCS